MDDLTMFKNTLSFHSLWEVESSFVNDILSYSKCNILLSPLIDRVVHGIKLAM